MRDVHGMAGEPMIKTLARSAAFGAVEALSVVLGRLRPRAPGPVPEPRRILVMELSLLGDLLLSTPLLAAIRERYPEAKVTLVCTPWAREAVAGNPDIDEVLTYEAFWEDRASGGRPKARHIASTTKLLSAFRKRDFDIAFVVSSRQQPFVPLLAYLSGARVRAGIKYKLGHRLLTHTVEDAGLHMVEQKLKILKAVDASPGRAHGLKYVVTDESRAWAGRFVGEAFGLADRPYVCMTPSTLQRQKLWGAGSWAGLIDMLAADGCGVVLGGGPADMEYVRSVRDRVSVPGFCVDASGVATLNQFAALMEGSTGLVTVESAPMHLAAAVGVPVVALFSRLYDFVRFRPEHPLSSVLVKDVGCWGCMTGCEDPVCMDFGVEEVYAAVVRMLDACLEAGHAV